MGSEKKTRNSSIEFLRIICMFGIISMHTFGIFIGTCRGANLVYGVGINSIFNMGVSIFMLITGYYGAKFSIKKLVSLEIIIMFYSILCVVISGFSISALVKACFPIATKRYWYMTSYMIILCLSEFINKIPEKLDRNQMRTILLVLIFFFYVMPSVFFVEIMEDSGKGIANMFTVYLIGRYIHMYYGEKKSISKYVEIAILTVLIEFIGNLIISLVRNNGVGLWCMWARDNSVFILLGSILVFMVFKNIEFHSKFVNLIAECIFGTYLLEGTVRVVLNHFFDLSIYGDSNILPLIIFAYVLVVMVICCLFEFVRKNTIGKMDKYIYDGVMQICNAYRKYKTVKN